MASVGPQNEVKGTQSVADPSSTDSHVVDFSLATSAAPQDTSVTASEQYGGTGRQHGDLSIETRKTTNPDTGLGNTPSTAAEDTASPDTHPYTSDTDGSRADSLDQQKDGQPGHIRSGSTKKPTSFKSVSVTKAFLAKTASTPTSSKLGDKGSASLTLQTALKPRLVAKSGVGTMRDTPRLKSAIDGTSEGATVWNRNRPAPAPTSKHFTDEELKQQYGIHLAERLRADGSGNQHKWADIDDDEDDWAPETVEWMDGTKSTVVPNDTSAAAMSKAGPVTNDTEASKPQIKPVLTALKKPVINGPMKTILRPGAAQQAKQEGGTWNSTPEQTPGLSASALTPTPAKSPWAPLPVVDKVPTLYSPPQQPAQPRSRFGNSDTHGFNAIHPPPPAREIEAGSFDRSWREGEQQTSRELFNSQSGRYEPAPEHRRLSNRHDNSARQTSLLHRSSVHATDGHIDGMPTVQHRPSIVGVERQSFGKTGQASNETRTGIIIGHDLGPQGPKPDTEQVQRAQEQARERAEEVARQKKIMQESRDLAVQRRREEYEREEAAKRERIRLRMEALPPLEQSNVDSPSTAHAKSPAQRPARTERQPIILQSRTNEADSARKSAEGLSREMNQQPTRDLNSSATMSAADKARFRSPRQTQRELDRDMSHTREHSSEVRQPSVFKSPPLVADSFATWGNTMPSQPATGSNVWGPPTAARRIGNGAFDSSYSRIAPQLHQQQGLSSPPTVSHIRARDQSQDLRQQDESPMTHQQILSDQFVTSLGLNDSSNDDRLAVGGTTATGTSRGLARQGQAYQPAPIAPPARAVSLQDPSSQSNARTSISAWGQFSAQAGQPRADMDPSFQPRTRDEPRPAAVPNPQRWKETFKQTRMQDEWLGGAREVVGTEKTVRGVQSPDPSVSQSQSIGGLSSPPRFPQAGHDNNTVRLSGAPSSSPAVRQASVSANGVRPIGSPGHAPQQSRFFPSASYGASPPPEEAEHPAFSGVSGQPHVHLPAPKAHVRLPPASTAAASTASRALDWQARFNGLLGRSASVTAIPLSPPKTPPEVVLALAPAVSTITRLEMNDVLMTKITTVSLPRTLSPNADVRVEAVASKSPVAALFDEELSFGSTPKVTVPRGVQYHEVSRVSRRKELPISKVIEAQSKQTSLGLYEGGKRSGIVTVYFTSSTRPAKDIAVRVTPKIGSTGRKEVGQAGKAGRRGVALDTSAGTPSPNASPAGKAKDRLVVRKGPSARRFESEDNVKRGASGRNGPEKLTVKHRPTLRSITKPQSSKPSAQQSQAV